MLYIEINIKSIAENNLYTFLIIYTKISSNVLDQDIQKSLLFKGFLANFALPLEDMFRALDWRGVEREFRRFELRKNK